MERQQLIVIEGQNASVTCTATGYPVPKVVWLNSDGSKLINSRIKSGTPIISSAGIGNVSVISLELILIGAMRGDTGMYRCSATNAINSTARNIIIILQGKM